MYLNIELINIKEIPTICKEIQTICKVAYQITTWHMTDRDGTGHHTGILWLLFGMHRLNSKPRSLPDYSESGCK